MGNCCSKRVVTIEHAIVIRSPTDERKCPETLVKVEPGKPQHVSTILEKHHQEHAIIHQDAEKSEVQADTSTERPQSETEVSPEPSNSASSPRDRQKPPVRMVKVASKKRRCVAIIWRKLYQRNPVFPWDSEEPQVQAGTSKERPQSKMEVSPKPANSSASPRDRQKPPVRMVKAVSKKHRFVSKFWRKLYRRNPIFPWDTEEPQVQAGTSKERSQSEMEVSPEPSNSGTSPRDQRKPPIRMVKVVSRKCMYGSNTLRQMCWRCPVVCKVSKKPEVQAAASMERPQSEMEVSPEPSSSAASPVDQQKPQGKMQKVISKKRRCVSAILKEISQKQASVPLNEDKPQVIAGTSREISHIKTEVVHKNVDTAPSPREQREPPVMMVKVESRKCRHIPDILRRIFQKNVITPQVVVEPPVSAHPSANIIEVKTEELPKRDDNASSPENREKTPVKVESKKRRHIPDILRRIFQKNAITPQVVVEPPVSAHPSANITEVKTEGKQNPPAIKEIFCRQEEFEPHDEGAWEEYKAYFPKGVRVRESRQTMASTLIGSYVAQVGDTDAEEQQNIDSTETFPDAFEVQHWELRKISSTIIPVVNVLYVSPPKSSDEDSKSIRKKKKKKRNRRKRYY